MKVGEWIKQTATKLKKAGIGSAQLDALILAEDELQKDRGYLLAHPEIELTPTQLKNLNAKLTRRFKHEPMAYIRGFSEFYGRRFFIDKRVLEPRPESETMIELLLNQKLPARPVIADIGTGSGAIAITAKLELPNSEVLATEIDRPALEIAQQNANTMNADITFLHGNLLDPLLTNYQLKTKNWAVLANLPYVPDNWQINEAAAMEPRVAIFGGPDGLELYRRLFGQIKQAKAKPKLIFTEALPPQHETLEKIALANGYQQAQTQDFIQIFRPL